MRTPGHAPRLCTAHYAVLCVCLCARRPLKARCPCMTSPRHKAPARTRHRYRSLSWQARRTASNSSSPPMNTTQLSGTSQHALSSPQVGDVYWTLGPAVYCVRVNVTTFSFSVTESPGLYVTAVLPAGKLEHTLYVYPHWFLCSRMCNCACVLYRGASSRQDKGTCEI